MEKEIKVKKRNGRLVNVDFGKIQTRIKKASTGLKVNYLEVATKVVQGLYDGVTTKELDKLAADTAASLTTNHPDYSKLASQIAVSALHKDTYGDFEKVFNILKEENLLNQEYIDRVISYGLENIKNTIDYSRDYQFDYFGYKTLEKAYLLKIYKDGNDAILERPQDMYMREAITVTKNLKDALETYNLLSNWNYTHATPTMFNSGLKGQQLASCFLINNKSDSKEGIMDTAKDVSIISSYAGGIGLSISNLRAAGSKIHSTNGTSNGILPYLRTFNELARFWDQGGNKRKGSFAMYLEPWHSDIFTLLDIRKTHGKEELRARDLFPALWIPDLFYKQVESNGDWYLSCPNEQLKAGFTRLYELHSEKFEEEWEGYLKYWSNANDLVKLYDVDIIWDEIATELDARNWTNLGEEMKRFLSQYRKRGIDIYANTQDFSMIDQRARLMISNVRTLKKIIGSRDISTTKPNPKYIWGLVMIRDVINFKETQIDKKQYEFLPGFMLIERELVEIYDTRQDIPASPPLPIIKKWTPIEHIGGPKDTEVEHKYY